MDPTLSLLMANLAQVNHTSITLDPFVGTGMLFAFLPLIDCVTVRAYKLVQK